MARQFFHLRCLFCTLAFMLCGCSTIASKDAEGFGRPYSGIACDGRYLLANTIKAESVVQLLFVPFILIDLPLSLVADTVVLPIDLVTTRAHEPQCFDPHMH